MKKSTELYFHLTFWSILIFSFFVPTFTLKHLTVQEYGEIASNSTYVIPISFYLGYLVAFQTRKSRKLLISIVAGLLALFAIIYILSPKMAAGFAVFFTTIPLWLTIGFIFKFFIDWFKKKEKINRLERENLQSRLDLLKSNIAPHFIFNTLHNIDTLIFTNQNKASESIIRLADIMRYMLKDANVDRTVLQSEITNIENYIELEKLRWKDPLFINLAVKGDFTKLEIAPMLLIPFVENAFKHSLDSNMKDGITISIEAQNRSLSFSCQNYFDGSSISTDGSHGIGLATVKKRLNLIYPHRHSLRISDSGGLYAVNLEITSDEN